MGPGVDPHIAVLSVVAVMGNRFSAIGSFLSEAFFIFYFYRKLFIGSFLSEAFNRKLFIGSFLSEAFYRKLF